jgi:hypothetical protein
MTANSMFLSLSHCEQLAVIVRISILFIGKYLTTPEYALVNLHWFIGNSYTAYRLSVIKKKSETKRNSWIIKNQTATHVLLLDFKKAFGSH